MRRHQHDDDEILKDGERLRVPLTLMDGIDGIDGIDPVQRAVARSTVVAAQHRPGFRLDAKRTTAADALDAAYSDYERDLRNSYKTPAGFAAADAKRTTHHYDPKGRLKGYSETETETEEDKDKDKDKDKAQDHQTKMHSIYDELDRELGEAWRR